jgi:hypothetical protein
MAVADVARRLRLQPWDHARRRELDLYAKDRGDEALERQVQLGIENYRCCWFRKGGPHHPACSKRDV